jgi:hypothetical protein
MKLSIKELPAQTAELLGRFKKYAVLAYNCGRRRVRLPGIPDKQYAIHATCFGWPTKG